MRGTAVTEFLVILYNAAMDMLFEKYSYMGVKESGLLCFLFIYFATKITYWVLSQNNSQMAAQT